MRQKQLLSLLVAVAVHIKMYADQLTTVATPPPDLY